MYNRIVPIMTDTEKQRAINKYSKHRPSLNWDIQNQKSVFMSGWNPLKGVNICFRDESETRGKISIIIEINTLSIRHGLSLTMATPYIPYICDDAQNSVIAYGYFFEKDPITKKINMMLRKKPFREREHITIYHNIQYFGLDHDEIVYGRRHILQSRFTLSNEWQDKALNTGVNLLYSGFRDFQYIVDLVNDFIQANKVREHLIPDVAHAFPLLNTISYEKYNISHNISVYMGEDGYMGHPNPNAIASIDDGEDDMATYVGDIVVV